MWQQTLSFCLILSSISKGSVSAQWDMKVSDVVIVPRGEDAVLNCSFTHRRQQNYRGSITVKWIAGDENRDPFLKCSVKNDSMDEPSGCSGSGLKHSLKGDPRRGDLSLLITKVHVADTGSYFCRVELDHWNSYFQKQTYLLVTVKPQILSLSVVETSSSSVNTTHSLQCEVEGHPPPNITWLSDSRGQLTNQIQTTTTSQDRLVSSVPYVEDEVFTCRVENQLGGAERRYPPSNRTVMITTRTVCCLIVLLLMSTGVVYYMRKRAAVAAESTPVYENSASAQAESSV